MVRRIGSFSFLTPATLLGLRSAAVLLFVFLLLSVGEGAAATSSTARSSAFSSSFVTRGKTPSATAATAFVVASPYRRRCQQDSRWNNNHVATRRTFSSTMGFVLSSRRPARSCYGAATTTTTLLNASPFTTTITTARNPASSLPTISPTTPTTTSKILLQGIDSIGPCLGSGSYGTVHLLQVSVALNDSPSSVITMVGKRAWTREELIQQQQVDGKSSTEPPSAPSLSSNNHNQQQQYWDEKAARCRYYWTVEQHCFAEKFMSSSSSHPSIPNYRGTLVSSTTTLQSPSHNNNSNNLTSKQPLLERQQQQQQHEWMLFDVLSAPAAIIPDTHTNPTSQQQQQQSIAPSLQDLLERDRLDRRVEPHHHYLYYTSQALLGSERNHSLLETLDAFWDQLLDGLVHVHTHRIVHRDIKPGNLLVAAAVAASENVTTTTTTRGRLVLLDFGSAADLDMATSTSNSGWFRLGPNNHKNYGLDDPNRVALSPIYAAPEVFIDAQQPDEALRFDGYSAALLYCQLLFQYLDERTESGFAQQLRTSNYDLDVWLQTALQSKVRPVGLELALEQVLAQRPGLWRLLQDLLQPLPRHRPSLAQAQERWRQIIEKSSDDDAVILDDGPYLAKVLESMELCPLVDMEEISVVNGRLEVQPPLTPSIATGSNNISTFTDPVVLRATTVRALHYVVSFDRRLPLGLVLAEADAQVDKKDDTDDNDNDPDKQKQQQQQQQWQTAIRGALSGELFVQKIVPGGQADQLGGVVAVGDRLQGVGELPLARGGFEKAVQMIRDQPRSAKNVVLHFDRKSERVGDTTPIAGSATIEPALVGPFQVTDQGAWSVKGRRQAQEDAVLLHEVHDTRDRSILLAGVLDGHLGSAASLFVQKELPLAFSTALLNRSSGLAEHSNNSSPLVAELLETVWNQVCDAYRSTCSLGGGDECVADYDPREGTLLAYTGGRDAVAGTTASLLALEPATGHLVTLNCGDSRSIVINSNGKLQYQTLDHTPETELQRLKQGKSQGLDYSIPQCRMGRWTLEVGEYDYAVARSLEGPFATSKGLTNEADFTLLQAEPGMTVVVATDGFWEVIDSEEACKVVDKLKRARDRTSAGDTAKALCSRAYEKGSSDNVSVVVLYID